MNTQRLTARRHSRLGFSLVEVIVAMGVLAVLLLGIAGTTINAIHLNEFMTEKQLAINLAESGLNNAVSTINGDALGDRFCGDGNAAPLASNNSTWGSGFPTPDARLKLLSVSGNDHNPKIEVEPFKYLSGTATKWNDPNQGQTANFGWREADYYVIRTTVRYVPATNRRSGNSNVLTQTARSVYFYDKTK